MNTTRFLATAIVAIFGLAIPGHGESWLPYNTVNKTLALVETKKVDNKDFGAFYMKSVKGEKIDLEKANFRVETWDGDAVPLECEVLSELPEDTLSEKAKEMMKQGFAYRIWIPRNREEFADGKLKHSLPKGSIEMGTELSIGGSIPLAPKK